MGKWSIFTGGSRHESVAIRGRRVLLSLCLVLACSFACTSVRGQEPPEVDLYDALLKKHVLDNGNVRYAELTGDLPKLVQYVEQIAAVSPESHPQLFPSESHELAYWINAYNALVLWAIAKDYPDKKDRLESLIRRGLFFYSQKFSVGGKQRTLDNIEKDSILKAFGEPRVHFALVCASASCPWLSRDAYRGERIEEQLESAARLFINQERAVQVDSTRREVRLSKIFDWYKDDFGGSPEAVLGYIAGYRRDDGPMLREGTWKIRYQNYDWSLNDAASSPQR